MTIEDDFQRALDANPEDWQTRLVFADWLQERGDPRAEGYRALGVQRYYPLSVRMASREWRGQTAWVYGGVDRTLKERQRHCLLGIDWFGLIERGVECDAVWRRRLKRREADDASAIAFASLPAERMAELLATRTAESEGWGKRRSSGWVLVKRGPAGGSLSVLPHRDCRPAVPMGGVDQRRESPAANTAVNATVAHRIAG